MDIRILFAAALLCTASISNAYIVDGSRINQPRLLSYATEKLPNQGTLQQTPDGYTYLKISDKYVGDLIQRIAKPGFTIPRYSSPNAVNGAHISVIYEQEAENIHHLKELGQTIKFKPLGFYTVVLDDQEYFMLAVDAPELSSLRLKYGLPEKLNQHAFHITIGVRKLQAHNEMLSAEEVAELQP